MYSFWGKSLSIDPINTFLGSQHPHKTQQFIIAVFAEWAERIYQQRPDDFDKQEAASIFLASLRQCIETGPSLGQEHKPKQGKEPEMVEYSPAELAKTKREIVALMESMTLAHAIEFLAEITSIWCLSMPENLAPLIPVQPLDRNGEKIPDLIYRWFERYFDLWT